MKKILFLIIAVICVSISSAQKNAAVYDTTPPYLKVPIIPPFKILQTDSATWFTKDELPKKKPVVIIYFSPDCHHCQLEAQEITDSMHLFKNAFIVFVSYRDMSDIRAFAEKYKLLNFSNIRIGRDPKYFVPSFYRVKFTPFVAVYSKKGELLNAFEGGAPLATIASLIK